MAKYTKPTDDSADVVRHLTMAEAKALPGMLGKLAAGALAFRGWYGYTEVETGHKVLIRRSVNDRGV